jgi:hypothetical protein
MMVFESYRGFVNEILSYLPFGAELLFRDKGKQHPLLQWGDVDGDGIHEVFGMYQYGQSQYVFVLKNVGGQYYFYHPLTRKVVNQAYRALIPSHESRAVYLFPAPKKGVGGSQWGYIDAKGRFVLTPMYDSAGDFQDNGLAIVGLMNQMGVIDAKGYFIVKPKYDLITPFSEGRAIVIDQQGFKVIDESGKEITEKAYSFISGKYKEGRVAAAIEQEQGTYLYGYLNKRGKEVIPFIYLSASEFNNGRAIVKTKENTFQLIDLTGKVLHSYTHAAVTNYGQGLLAFKRTEDGPFGYMNEQGKTVIEPSFSEANPFFEGVAIVALFENNKLRYGLINLQGQFKIKPNYHDLIRLGENRFAVGKAIDPEQPCKRSIYALSDADGHLMTGFNFYEITPFQDGKASVSDEQNTYFIDRNGRRLENLPKVSGSGTLQLEKTLIKGNIDQRLSYYNQNGELIWKQPAILPLSKQLFVYEQKYRPNKDYLVYYPQLQGVANQARVNKELRELAGVKPVPAHKPLNSNYVGDFEVSFYRKNLLVIEINGYDYPFCAAHGMPIKKHAHINVKTGQMYQLKELFKQGSPYVTRISELIADQIKSNTQSPYFFPEQYHGIKEDQPFFINGSGLNIYFQPYEIAAFAAGFPTFTIPFDELKGMINETGSFWLAFH